MMTNDNESSARKKNIKKGDINFDEYFLNSNMKLNINKTEVLHFIKEKYKVTDIQCGKKTKLINNCKYIGVYNANNVNSYKQFQKLKVFNLLTKM